METRQFKENVKGAASYLQQQGFDVPHTQLLEAISRSFGERNWSTMRALLEAGPQSVAEPFPSSPPPLSSVAALICKEIRREMWDQVFGICSRMQAETMVAQTAARIAPGATDAELAEALAELWVD
jgi:hypothetical protein